MKLPYIGYDEEKEKAKTRKLIEEKIEKVKVIIRVKPLDEKDKKEKIKSCIKISPD